MPSLKCIYLIQTALVFVSAIIIWWVDWGILPGFLGGAALMTINFSLLVWLWQRILSKKPIATTLGLVVIKYAVLGTFLYVFVSKLRVEVVPFFVGVSTIGGSILLASIQSVNFGRNPAE